MIVVAPASSWFIRISPRFLPITFRTNSSAKPQSSNPRLPSGHTDLCNPLNAPSPPSYPTLNSTTLPPPPTPTTPPPHPNPLPPKPPPPPGPKTPQHPNTLSNPPWPRLTSALAKRENCPRNSSSSYFSGNKCANVLIATNGFLISCANADIARSNPTPLSSNPSLIPVSPLSPFSLFSPLSFVSLLSPPTPKPKSKSSGPNTSPSFTTAAPHTPPSNPRT